MTSAPPDLLAFRHQIISLTGLNGLSVGIVGDSAHAATGGYHEGKSDLARVGRYHTWATAGSNSEDYSVRLQRDRDGLTDHASAIDIGYDWPHGGNQAWLKFNNLLAADLRAGQPALAAVRAVNYSPDGTLRRRIDRENGFAVEVSSDSVDIHTHIECFRDTEGRRQDTLNRLVALIRAAITGGDMAGEADYAFSGVYPGADPRINGRSWMAQAVGNPIADAVQRLGRIEAALAKAQPAALTDTQAAALADTIAARLVASNSNGLTAADHAAIVADVKAALQQGTAR